MARYKDIEPIIEFIANGLNNPDKSKAFGHDAIEILTELEYAPTADVAEVEKVSEQIIRKKAEVTEYWKNDVKQYRTTKGYSDIEHDTDNFLRGYNEAVEDMLAILGGARMDGDEDDV